MKKSILSLSALLAIGLSQFASAVEYDLKDPKGVNNVVFLLDAPLESINGTATGVTGSMSFDPEHPEKTSGKVVVSVASMTVPNPKMQEHLMGENWLNEAKYPEITFELASLKNVKKKGDKYEGTAHGTMTIKGTSKEMEVPVSVTYLPGMMKARQGKEGDIAVIRSSFTVSRSDFGVNAGNNEDKVSDEVNLRLSIAGFAPQDS